MQFVQKLFILILCLEEIALMPSDKLFPELCTHIRMQNFKARINVFTLFLETVRLLFNIYSFCRHISVIINLKMKVFQISFVHLSNVSNVWIVFFNFRFEATRLENEAVLVAALVPCCFWYVSTLCF